MNDSADPVGQVAGLPQNATPIALGLLAEERERLLQDHYEDGEPTDCDGCQRAYHVRLEILYLERP